MTGSISRHVGFGLNNSSAYSPLRHVVNDGLSNEETCQFDRIGGHSLLRRRLGARLRLYFFCSLQAVLSIHSSQYLPVADCKMHVNQMKSPIGLNLAVCNNIARNVIGARIFCVRTNSHCHDDLSFVTHSAVRSPGRLTNGVSIGVVDALALIHA